MSKSLWVLVLPRLDIPGLDKVLVRRPSIAEVAELRRRADLVEQHSPFARPQPRMWRDVR